MRHEASFYTALLTPIKKIEFIAEQLGIIRDVLEDVSDELFREDLGA